MANGCRVGTTFCSFIPSSARHSKQSRAAGGKTSVMTYEWQQVEIVTQHPSSSSARRGCEANGFEKISDREPGPRTFHSESPLRGLLGVNREKSTCHSVPQMSQRQSKPLRVVTK